MAPTSRISRRANAEAVERIATAPSVCADASDAVGMFALVQGARREDVKVTIEVAPSLQVSHFSPSAA